MCLSKLLMFLSVCPTVCSLVTFESTGRLLLLYVLITRTIMAVVRHNFKVQSEMYLYCSIVVKVGGVALYRSPSF